MKDKTEHQAGEAKSVIDVFRDSMMSLRKNSGIKTAFYAKSDKLTAKYRPSG